VFIARNRFAVLDKPSATIQIRNLQNEITKKCPPPCATTDAIFYAGTGTLLCRSEDKVRSAPGWLPGCLAAWGRGLRSSSDITAAPATQCLLPRASCLPVTGSTDGDTLLSKGRPAYQMQGREAVVGTLPREAMC
jgi:hypothetical protein